MEFSIERVESWINSLLEDVWFNTETSFDKFMIRKKYNIIK